MEIGTIRQINYGDPVYAPSDQKSEQRRLAAAVNHLNKQSIFGEANELTFATDPETQRIVVRIINRETKEVVQQLPPEYVLRMADDRAPEAL